MAKDDLVVIIGLELITLGLVLWLPPLAFVFAGACTAALGLLTGRS